MNENCRVAYFSMEIGLRNNFKTYSGGLGVLAGDLLKSASDINYKMTGITLLYREGYLKQILDKEEGQKEEPDNWDYQENLQLLEEQIQLQIKQETVNANIWRYQVGETVDILFLDTGLEENSDFAKNLTRQLYAPGQDTRLAQEALLGIGGIKALQKLSKNPEIHHMNEGHSALLTTQLYKQYRQEGYEPQEAQEKTTERCVFTTHTPVEAGHDKFNEDLVREIIPQQKQYLEETGFFDLNTTKLALKNSKYVNAVSKKHGEVSKDMFPETDIDWIVNGIHSQTFTNPYLKEKLDSKIPLWREEPARLTQTEKLTKKEIWETHQKRKTDLIEHINQSKENTDFSEDILTLGFARRATSYKRMDILFKDLDRIEDLASEYEGLQIVLAGKAHPEDTAGKELISKVLNYSNILEEADAVFLEDYDMELGKLLTSGVDVWVNTPVRGKEASGTSGMKAAHNGVPHLSILDGWWLEGHIEGKTGWSIGEDYVEGENPNIVDSKSIYNKLEEILQTYHHDREEWIKIMQTTITTNASFFNSQRMLKDYIAKAYQK